MKFQTLCKVGAAPAAGFGSSASVSNNKQQGWLYGGGSFDHRAGRSRSVCQPWHNDAAYMPAVTIARTVQNTPGGIPQYVILCWHENRFCGSLLAESFVGRPYPPACLDNRQSAGRSRKIAWDQVSLSGMVTFQRIDRWSGEQS